MITAKLTPDQFDAIETALYARVNELRERSGKRGVNPELKNALHSELALVQSARTVLFEALDRYSKRANAA